MSVYRQQIDSLDYASTFLEAPFNRKIRFRCHCSADMHYFGRKPYWDYYYFDSPINVRIWLNKNKFKEPYVETLIN